MTDPHFFLLVEIEKVLTGAKKSMNQGSLLLATPGKSDGPSTRTLVWALLLANAAISCAV